MPRAVIIAASLALGLAGCNTIEGQNAAGGAVAGASNGAMIGGTLSMGHPAGFVVGGVVGAASGAMVASAAAQKNAAPAQTIAMAPLPAPPPPAPVAQSPEPRPSYADQPPPEPRPSYAERPQPAPRPVYADRPPPREQYARDEGYDPGYPPRRRWSDEVDGPGPYGYDPDRWAYRHPGPALGYAPGGYYGDAPFPPPPRHCPVLVYDGRGDLVCAY